MFADSPLWPDAVDRVLLEEVDSTMAEAARRASGLTRPTWIAARHQTAARGRRGRAWHHPDGNFAATLVLRPDLPPEQMALTSFQAALALYDTLAPYVGADRLSLKWPNDVLLDGRKLAGILLETGGASGRIDWLAVGIGINMVAAPQASELEHGAVAPISLSEAGARATGGSGPVTIEEMLEHLAHHMDHYTHLWRQAGFDALRRLWLSRAARLGEVITARTSTTTHSGVFETVDSDGRLVLRSDGGLHKITAAEIFF